jgi:hypothetical protein
MIRDVHPGSRIQMLTFYPSRTPDPGVKKAPDPGSGSANLHESPVKIRYLRPRKICGLESCGLILTQMPYRYLLLQLFFSLRKRSFGLFLIRIQIQDLDPDPNPKLTKGRIRIRYRIRNKSFGSATLLSSIRAHPCFLIDNYATVKCLIANY